MTIAKNAVVLALVAFISVPAMAKDEAVDLRGAYSAAIKKTEVIPIEESQRKQYESLVNQAKSAFAPSLSAGVSLGLGDPGNFSGVAGAASFGLNAVQPIYQGGKFEASLAAAQSGKLANELSQKASRVALFSAVSHAYSQILMTEQDIKNLKFIITQTDEIITELTKRVNIGKSKQSEVLMARSQQAVQQSELKTIEGNLESSRELFAFLTGLKSETKLTDVGASLPQPKGKLGYYLELVKNRPDIGYFNANIEVNRQLIKAEAAANAPQLSLFGDFYPYRSGSNHDIYWDAGIGINLNLFNGDLISSRISGAEAKLKESELDLDKQMRQDITEIKTSYKNYVSLKGQVDSLENALSITKKNYEVQKQDYIYGLVTNLDVLQAFNTLQSTKRSFDKTRYMVFSAWTDVLASTNQLPEGDK